MNLAFLKLLQKKVKFFFAVTCSFNIFLRPVMLIGWFAWVRMSLLSFSWLVWVHNHLLFWL